jgi:hypothetical protein
MEELLASWRGSCAVEEAEEEDGEKTGEAVVVADASEIEVVSTIVTPNSEAIEDAKNDGLQQTNEDDDDDSGSGAVDQEDLDRWMRVLATPPVLNAATLYTTIMSASLSWRPSSTSSSSSSSSPQSSEPAYGEEGDQTTKGVYLSLGVGAV